MAWDPADPHGGRRPLIAGEALGSASSAIVALHGRGAGPEDILPLAVALGGPGYACLAPRAAGNAWYPHGFMRPIEDNQPWLDSALAAVRRSVDEVQAAGVAQERIVLMGFSQGGCLALEFAARNAVRYAGLLGFSAGLIGPPGTLREYAGSLAGTPAFLGCSDVDPHIPRERVEESAHVLRGLGAALEVRLYPGLGHMVNEDEVARARRITAGLS